MLLENQTWSKEFAHSVDEFVCSGQGNGVYRSFGDVNVRSSGWEVSSDSNHEEVLTLGEPLSLTRTRDGHSSRPLLAVKTNDNLDIASGDTAQPSCGKQGEQGFQALYRYGGILITYREHMLAIIDKYETVEAFRTCRSASV